MKPSRDERLHATFVAACDLPTGERAAYVDEACADDSTLRAEVYSLLDFDTDEHDVLAESQVSGGAWLQNVIGELPPASVGLTGFAGAPIPSGTRIGNYTIREVLGRGGMGLVYAADQDEPRRSVALKMVRSDTPSRALFERFRREVQLLGRLRHPGIAQIFEAGSFDLGGVECPYFAMERVDGLTIAEYARTHRLSTARKLELLAQVADAIHHANECGVVHRDLKPANVLVEANDVPKVLDFGVARLLGDHAGISTLHTDPGQLIGTLPYMSPEQITGDSEVDRRADVYALGVLTFELLTGKLPLDLRGRSIPEASRIILEEEPTRLSTLDPSLAGDLEVVAERSLAKEPQRRYRSARELAEDLRRSAAGRPIEARPITTFHHLTRFARRHRGLVAGVGLAFLILCAAFLVVLAQRDIAREALGHSEHQAYRANLAAIESAFRTGQPLEADRLLEEIPTARRGWEWRHYSHRLEEEGWRPSRSDFFDAALNSDGSRVITVARDGRLRTYAGTSEEPLSSVSLTDRVVHVAALSPDGDVCAALLGGSPARVQAWRIEEAGFVSLFEVELDLDSVASPPESLKLSTSRNRTAWYQSTADTVGWVQHDSGERGEFPFGSQGANLQLTLAGDMVAVANPFGRSLVHHLESGLRGLPRISTGYTAIALSRDHRWLFLGARDKQIRRVSLHGEEPQTETLQGHIGVVRAIAYDDRGERLVSVGADKTLRVWDTRTHATTHTLYHQGPSVARVDLAGDRVLVFNKKGELLLLNLEKRMATHVLEGHKSFIYPVDASPNGLHVASGSWDRTVRCWSVEDGSLAWKTNVGHAVHAVEWSPDGSIVAVAGKSSRVHFIDATSGAILRAVDSGVRGARDIVWLEGGERVAIAPLFPSKERTPRVTLQTLNADGQPFGAAHLETPLVRCLAVSPSEDRLALGSSGRVDILDVSSLQPIHTLVFPADSVEAIDYHPDGNHIAAVDSNGALFLLEDLPGGSVRKVHSHDQQIWAAKWSRDGSRLATGAHDGIIRLFDSETFALMAQLQGHEDYVYSLDFGPKDGFLVSGSGDHDLRLWRAR